MKLNDEELVDLAMNNAYAMLVGNKSIDDLLDDQEEMVLVPDPEITDGWSEGTGKLLNIFRFISTPLGTCYLTRNMVAIALIDHC